MTYPHTHIPYTHSYYAQCPIRESLPNSGRTACCCVGSNYVNPTSGRCCYSQVSLKKHLITVLATGIMLDIAIVISMNLLTSVRKFFNDHTLAIGNYLF